jgi:hypothetical protein
MLTVCRGIFGTLVLLSLLPTAASAEFKPTAAQRAACASDVMKLCMAHYPNGDRVLACLTANKSQLSPACRKAHDAVVASK